ncbi:MAG: SDR family oxidoreductase, partial [Dactylosporangium sp.]|nr:SDR family oxidoreductase [Dactylosporangium sp.]NNJ62915.1 SDR family oxidoreductase [Dactylosporangium sp.]
RLVLAARRADRLRALAAELPDALAVPTDLTRPDEIQALADQAVATYGRIDVLVNNAAQGLHVPLAQVATDDFRAIMELNVYAPLRAMQVVAPVMRASGGGAIINISSGTTRRVVPGLGAYAATKSALNTLSQTARAEWAADGIVVSTVYPSLTRTDFHDSLRAGSMIDNGLQWYPAADVAESILQTIVTGAAETVLAPRQTPK